MNNIKNEIEKMMGTILANSFDVHIVERSAKNVLDIVRKDGISFESQPKVERIEKLAKEYAEKESVGTDDYYSFSKSSLVAAVIFGYRAAKEERQDESFSYPVMTKKEWDEQSKKQKQ